MASYCAIACSHRDLNTQEETTQSKFFGFNPSNDSLYVDQSFGLSSPLGDKILLQSQEWALRQVEESEELLNPDTVCS